MKKPLASLIAVYCKAYGEILQDIINGKEVPWREKRLRSEFLAECLRRLGMIERAFNVARCATRLEFAVCPNDGYKKLTKANFCRDRLCPMCNWRRSRKMQAQIFQVLNAAVERQKMRFVMLKIDVANVPGDKLGEAIDEIFSGFKRLFELKCVDDYVIGFVRNLEVTYNETMDTYHPHSHILMAMKPSYFSQGYMDQDEWTSLWQQSARLIYKPIIYVQEIVPRAQKGNEEQTLVGAAMEVGKYAVKDSDYIHYGNEALTDKVVPVFASALYGRRLIAYGKLFRQLKKELKLQDVESDKADLVGADEEAVRHCKLCNSELVNQVFGWFYGYKIYARLIEDGPDNA